MLKVPRYNNLCLNLQRIDIHHNDFIEQPFHQCQREALVFCPADEVGAANNSIITLCPRM
jgi:hypothetical protein